VTYANAYQPPAPVVVISPSSANIAAAVEEELFVSDRSTESFMVTKVGSVAGAVNFTYHVIETGFINPPSTKLT